MEEDGGCRASRLKVQDVGFSFFSIHKYVFSDVREVVCSEQTDKRGLSCFYVEVAAA